MEQQTNPQPPFFHLVGSAPFPSSEESFRFFVCRLPSILQQLPDGEPGIRKDFVQWQRTTFPPQLVHGWRRPSNPNPGDPTTDLFANETSLSEAEVDDLCKELHTKYDEYAMESYALFQRLRDEGVIPQGVRFQVCLPTPMDAMPLLWPKYRPVVEPWYEKALLRDLRTIQDTIPHEDLAVQWDCCVPFPMLERFHEQQGLLPLALAPWFEDATEGVMERLGRIMGGGFVDAGIPMGVHLCYGDLEHKHFVEPQDLGWCVRVGLDIMRRLNETGKKLSWMHMPVPRERFDTAYFAPLTTAKEMLQQTGTCLVLGLLHPDDEATNRKRLKAAKAVLADDIPLGLSSECGLARTSKEDVEAIFEVGRLLCQK